MPVSRAGSFTSISSSRRSSASSPRGHAQLAFHLGRTNLDGRLDLFVLDINDVRQPYVQSGLPFRHGWLGHSVLAAWPVPSFARAGKRGHARGPVPTAISSGE